MSVDVSQLSIFPVLFAGEKMPLNYSCSGSRHRFVFFLFFFLSFFLLLLLLLLVVVHASCSDPSLVLQYNYLSDGTLTASSPFTAIDNLSVYFEMPGFGTRYLECWPKEIACGWNHFV